MAQSAISQLEREIASNNVSVILYTGDWVRHGTGALSNPAQDMVAIFTQVAALLQTLVQSIAARAGKSVPHLVPHPTAAWDIGNEDFYPDYNANEESIPTSNVRAYGQALEAHGLLTANQSVQYSQCAFYESQHPSGTLTILALNTVLYNKKAKATTSDPCGQLAWLGTRLASAQNAGRKVYITAHIPPMLGMWETTYVNAFNSLIQSYSGTISALFFGHTHMTAFMAPASLSYYPPVFIGGSVTRQSKTNTCYQRYAVNNQWAVVKWEQIRLSASQLGTSPVNATWQLSMNVGDTFGMGNNTITNAGMAAAAASIHSSTTAFNNVDLLLGGGYPFSLVAEVCDNSLLGGLCQKALSCVFTEQTLEALVACAVLSKSQSEVTALRALMVRNH